MVVSRAPFAAPFPARTASAIVPLLLFGIAVGCAGAAVAQGGHTGTATARTAPELSDVALFVMAAAGIWFTRRALRNRARKD